MSTPTQTIREELQRGDELEQRLFNGLAVLRESNESDRERTLLDTLIYDPASFEQMVQKEQARCVGKDDVISVIEIAYDQELTTKEELALMLQLIEVGSNPGDFVGVTGENRYAVALPWTNQEEAATLASIASGMAQYVAPTKSPRCGTQTLSAQQIRTPVEFHPAESLRRYSLSASAGRSM